MADLGLFDGSKTFEENRDLGPFGDFANDEVVAFEMEPTADFFGTPVHFPFGIPAGPLTSEKIVKSVFDKGFPIATLKSVRTTVYPANVMPQLTPVESKPLTPADSDQAFLATAEFGEPMAASNSFGIPSVGPEDWQPLMRQALKMPGKGQTLLTAFQGTARGEGAEAFIQDHVKGIGLMIETGAKTIEINLSCPNEGNAHLVCFDTVMSGKIAQAVKTAYPEINLIMKIAYFADPQQLAEFVKAVGPFVDGISGINTIARKVVKADGSEFFPGRPMGGVSGAPIKPYGLETVRELVKLRNELGFNYKILGMGGVLTPEDYKKYLDAGADFVFSATGAMWNAYLAEEIQATI